MYLIDTNVFLELMLEQQKAKSAREFFQRVDSTETCVSDFSLHSMGVILFRLKKREVFSQFLDDMVLNGGVQILRLELEDASRLVQAAELYDLDFDDAYQYVAADKFGLQIVSFDSDFDRTDKGRKTPEVIGA